MVYGIGTSPQAIAFHTSKGSVVLVAATAQHTDILGDADEIIVMNYDDFILSVSTSDDSDDWGVLSNFATPSD